MLALETLWILNNLSKPWLTWLGDIELARKVLLIREKIVGKELEKCMKL